MRKFSCPSCGAEVRFQSAISVSATCAYCQSLLVRHDVDVEIIGKAGVLQQDVSPLQIGTSGKYKNTNFQLVGRLCQKWTDGFWNEWFAYFDDGSTGWLAEAQGFYMMSFETPVTQPPVERDLSPGKKVAVDKVFLTVDDVKQAECIATGGELPIIAALGRKCTSVDLSGDENLFGCLDYSKEGVRFFLGKYLDYDAFHFSNVREIDGW